MYIRHLVPMLVCTPVLTYLNTLCDIGLNKKKTPTTINLNGRLEKCFYIINYNDVERMHYDKYIILLSSIDGRRFDLLLLEPWTQSILYFIDHYD